MLTQSFKNKINENLNSRYCKPYDFLIEDGTGNVVMKNIKITYKYIKDYYLIINFDENSQINYLSYAPGSVLARERRDIISINELWLCQNEWIKNLDNEIKIIPQIRNQNENENRINKIESDIEELFKEKEDFNLTVEEVERLKERLDKFEQEFEEKLNNNNVKYENTEKIISELKKEIETLKLQSNIMTKKNWFISFITKMYRFTQAHPKISALIGSSLFLALPEGIKDVVKDDYIKALLPEVLMLEKKEEEIQEETQEQMQ